MMYLLEIVELIVSDFGNDLILGNDGNDYYLGAPMMIIDGGSGDDYLFADTQKMTPERLKIWKASGIVTYEYDDVGDDIVLGQSGNDIIIGGVGSDVLMGGADNDAITIKNNYKIIHR